MSLLSFQQESMIFFPQKLSKEHSFSFNTNFEEVFVPTTDGDNLHGLLFKSENAKGLVFYLHGNAGSVDTWGWISPTYTDLNYDIFILDYRGYGKSGGNISSEKQFYQDVQAAYDVMKTRYDEKQIVIVGYSIGTAAAAMLASTNEPALLILQAPYYSLGDLMKKLYPFVPAFLLQYKFETFRFVEKTTAPVVLFHGVQDEIIYSGSSEKLKSHLKPGDRVVLLENLGHNGMNEDPTYQKNLATVLATLDQN